MQATTVVSFVSAGLLMASTFLQAVKMILFPSGRLPSPQLLLGAKAISHGSLRFDLTRGGVTTRTIDLGV